MEKMPTAEEFRISQCIDIGQDLFNSGLHELMIEFAKLHVQAALEEASKKVEKGEFYIFGSNDDEYLFDKFMDESTIGCLKFSIDKESILNAYPLDKIK